MTENLKLVDIRRFFFEIFSFLLAAAVDDDIDSLGVSVSSSKSNAIAFLLLGDVWLLYERVNEDRYIYVSIL